MIKILLKQTYSIVWFLLKYLLLFLVLKVLTIASIIFIHFLYYNAFDNYKYPKFGKSSEDYSIINTKAEVLLLYEDKTLIDPSTLKVNHNDRIIIGVAFPLDEWQADSYDIPNCHSELIDTRSTNIGGYFIIDKASKIVKPNLSYSEFIEQLKVYSITDFELRFWGASYRSTL